MTLAAKKYDIITALSCSRCRDASMKLCPQCTSIYSDDHTICPVHGHILNEIIELRPGLTIRGSYRIVRKLGEVQQGKRYAIRSRG